MAKAAKHKWRGYAVIDADGALMNNVCGGMAIYSSKIAAKRDGWFFDKDSIVKLQSVEIKLAG